MTTTLKSILSTLLIICVFVTLQGQTIQINPTKPHPNINYDRLKRIDDVVNDFISKKRIAGAVTILVKDGQVIQHKGYGYDDIDAKTPLSKDAIFRIASQTKAITSVGIMILIEEGKLLLNDPLSKYMPEYKKQVVLDKFNEKDTTFTTLPAKRDITIKDLLTHTSGLGYAGIGSPTMRAIYAKYGIPAGLEQPNANLIEKMSALGKLPLEYQPGERFNYSLGNDVLGALIEKLSGMSLETFFKKRILDPLGMKDTHFNLPSDRHSRLAQLYMEDTLQQLIKMPSTKPDDNALSKTSRGNYSLGVNPDYPKLGITYFSGGGGLSSTAMDYAIFLQMLLNKGTYNGVEILAPPTVEMMLRNQIGDIPFGNNKFSLGFSTVTEKATDDICSTGTFSWGGAFATAYWADPKQNMVYLIMTQQIPSTYFNELKSKFLVALYQSLKN